MGLTRVWRFPWIQESCVKAPRNAKASTWGLQYLVSEEGSYVLVLRLKTRGIPDPWFVVSLCLCGLLGPYLNNALFTKQGLPRYIGGYKNTTYGFVWSSELQTVFSCSHTWMISWLGKPGHTVAKPRSPLQTSLCDARPQRRFPATNGTIPS